MQALDTGRHKFQTDPVSQSENVFNQGRISLSSLRSQDTVVSRNSCAAEEGPSAYLSSD